MATDTCKHCDVEVVTRNVAEKADWIVRHAKYCNGTAKELARKVN